MGYERNPRGDYPRDDYYGNREQQDYGRGYGAERDREYGAGRDYQTTADYDRDRSARGQHRDAGGYGQRSYGANVAQRDTSYAPPRYDQGRGDTQFRGGYGSADRQFGSDRGRAYQSDRGYGRRPEGYDYDERGFFARAGDEVRSWFGDEEAEQRREADLRYDERGYGARSSHDRDSDYGNWRSSQIAALDRDYDEYRREHRAKFENEFSSWRSNRQTQRDSLGKVEEHMDVVGSDGSHVGTVDKVRGDRILLTKNDADAGGRHHSIPSSWITTVDTKVTLAKTADEAKRQWRDEERSQALFGDRDREEHSGRDAQGRILNRSFSGTY